MNQKHLLRKMQSAQATRRIWIDEQAEPFPTVNCFCGEAQDLDYEQGFQLMASRLNAFLDSHEGCWIEEEQAS